MQCEMCGSEGKMFRTEIEGTEMNLCKSCSSFGRVKSEIKPPESIKRPKKDDKESKDRRESVEIAPKTKKEITQEMNEDYARIIARKRQNLGLKQKELALKMAEKESLIHKVEAGQFRPSLKLARKFEKALGVRIIEQHVEEYKQSFRAKHEKMTIGDLMYIKKSKKE